MKSIKKMIFLVCSVLSLSAVSQQLERQVIASAGSNSSSSFTIGEAIVTSSNLEVTVGFQQPSFLAEPALSIRDITSDLTVYPVPTKDELTISGLNFTGETTHVSLYTIEGKITNVPIESFGSEIKLNLSRLPSGNYFLTLNDESNRTSAKFKILKIN